MDRYILLYTSSLPTKEPFTECSTPPVVWEGCAVCAFDAPACRLKCAKRLCLCVPKCEITPLGVLNRREEEQPVRPGVLAMAHSRHSRTAHLESNTPTLSHHVPDSIWHRILAVTLSVYWLGCPGWLTSPLGLREALSCSLPLPFTSPLWIPWDTYGNSCPRKQWKVGSQNKTK